MSDERTVPAPPELAYTRLEEHLRQAVHCLVGDGPMRVRLGLAMISLAQLQPTDVPETLRQRFEQIVSQLRESAEYFSFRMPYVNMRKPRSGRIAREIFDLYIKLRGGI
jgi:hypothetical protein